MTLELLRGGDLITKTKIKGYLKNLTENIIDKIDEKGLINKNKITYIKDNTKHEIRIINNEKVLLLRENNDFSHNFIFEKNKQNTSEYYLKENKLSLEINIKVLELNINNYNIYIKYEVEDSNTIYEYKIEVSDKI